MAHILLVEDEPGLCEVLQIALEEHDTYHVSLVNCGDLALAALERAPPDLAVIDAILPKVSGLAVARRVISAGIPVLLITGHPHVAEMLVRADCPFILKPFLPSALLTAAASLLLNKAAHGTRMAAALNRVAETPRSSAHFGASWSWM